MIHRRALLAAAAFAARPAAAQRYHPIGTKHLDLRFAGAGGVTLSGTLLLPTISELQRVPGVVLVAGSGPTDRDGNNRYLAEKIDLLKQIAGLLADNGIATLRYDKRGIGASTPQPESSLGAQERFWAWDHFVADVQAAHAELLRHDEIKPYATALLGHSEGGLLSLAAAQAMGKKGPYAIVLASTPGRPLQGIVHDQIARSAPAFAAEADRIMRTIIETGHAPDDTPQELKLVFPASAGAFLQRALTFDPARALEAIDASCLLLQGSADTQVVPMADVQPLVDALSQRSRAGEVAVFPMVSHNLKAVSGPNDPGFTGPIASPVADKLSSWLKLVLGA
ncbi:MAG: alpha/beta fold hydrolase [Proteobacteria bacterium]|nr:alpha/beta fold hydrolase [Pseudomonadota bacterium]